MITPLKEIHVKLILIRESKSSDNISDQNINKNCAKHRKIKNKNKKFQEFVFPHKSIYFFVSPFLVPDSYGHQGA
jgi:hypothetical protein